MTDMDPESAARIATGDVSGGVEEVSSLPEPPDAQRADTGGSAGTVIDGLLETKPPGSVEEYPDMPDAGAHALIGAQKFVNGIAGDRDLDGGKPAIVDFIQAGVSLFSGGDTTAPADSVDNTDDAAETPAPAPAGDVGGDLRE